MESDLRERTKQFALRIIRLHAVLPQRGATLILGNQILKSGTSVGAHYREARRAKSNADFISKIEGALQELDETGYWLELLGDSGILKKVRLKPLYDETNELISIFVTIVRKTKSKGSLRTQRRRTAPTHSASD
jgi:four helix bundle protein